MLGYGVPVSAVNHDLVATIYSATQDSFVSSIVPAIVTAHVAFKRAAPVPVNHKVAPTDTFTVVKL